MAPSNIPTPEDAADALVQLILEGWEGLNPDMLDMFGWPNPKDREWAAMNWLRKVKAIVRKTLVDEHGLYWAYDKKVNSPWGIFKVSESDKDMKRVMRQNEHEASDRLGDIAHGFVLAGRKGLLSIDDADEGVNIVKQADDLIRGVVNRFEWRGLSPEDEEWIDENGYPDELG